VTSTISVLKEFISLFISGTVSKEREGREESGEGGECKRRERKGKPRLIVRTGDL
jgi:hypothetical protein